MTKSEFITAIESAGFEVENNRVSIKNDLGVSLLDVLDAKGFTNQPVGKFVEYSFTGANFTVNVKALNPVFATVDLN